jgi:DNA-directed RNA polymerase subunit RPC12/RpoP
MNSPTKADLAELYGMQRIRCPKCRWAGYSEDLECPRCGHKEEND